MCMNCGCHEYNEKHKPTDITIDDLKAAAKGHDMEVEKAADNIREVREETTITELDFRWGEVYRETPPYNQGQKVARYYIAATPTEHVELPVSPELGRPEHSEYRWVTRDEAWGLLTPRVRAVLRWSDAIVRPRRRRHG